MHPIDFNLKDEPWKVFDLLASFWGASQNVDQPLYWIERDIGKKDYRLVFAAGQTRASFEQVYDSLPMAQQWLDDLGWNNRTHFDNIQELVKKHIEDSTWDAERLPEEKIVRSHPRRPPPIQWSFYPLLRKAYWSGVLSIPGFGRSVDQWAVQMKETLSEPKTAAGEEWVNNRLRKLMERQPDWEIQSGQSFRAWAAEQPSWDKVLNRWNISFRVSQDSVPLVLWAIEKGWESGAQRWCDESGLSFHFVPSVQDIPEHWWTSEEDVPSGSLWHWACRVAPDAFVRELMASDASLKDSKDLLGRTGLHWACAPARASMVELLVNAGVSVSEEDEEGKIAAEMIPEWENSLFEALEDYRLARKKKEFTSPLGLTKSKTFD